MNCSPAPLLSEIAEEVMHDLGVLLHATEDHGELTDEITAVLGRALDDVSIVWDNAMHDEAADLIDAS